MWSENENQVDGILNVQRKREPGRWHSSFWQEEPRRSRTECCSQDLPDPAKSDGMMLVGFLVGTPNLNTGKYDPGNCKGPSQPMKSSVKSSFCGRCYKGWVLLVRDKPVDNKTPNKGSQHPDPGQRDCVDGEARGFSKAVEEVAKTKTHQIRLIPEQCLIDFIHRVHHNDSPEPGHNVGQVHVALTVRIATSY